MFRFLSYREEKIIMGKNFHMEGKISSAFIRLRYGYCYRDTWSIDQWFLTVVPNMRSMTLHQQPSLLRLFLRDGGRKKISRIGTVF